MLADVLTSAASWNSEQPLLTYLVPEELQTKLQVGQLVAIPYGEKLVEGIVWRIHPDNVGATLAIALAEDGVVLRPMSAILDPEPALLPHQMALAQWIAEYYVTPLAQVTLMMLTRGLIQRSQFVLRLAESVGTDTSVSETPLDAVSLRLQALVGLLLADKELDVEQLKKMLGPTLARKFLKEALASGHIERKAQLQAPCVKPRRKRLVRLVAFGEALEEWQQKKEAVLQESLAAANRPVSPHPIGNGRQTAPNPWAISNATATLEVPIPQDQAGLAAQRQLAAVDLLLNSNWTTGTAKSHRDWTPNRLCKASKLTPEQLRQLVKEHIVTIEETEVRRDPLAERVIPATAPLQLTPDQQRAVDCILSDINGNTSITQDSKPILLYGVTGSGKTEVYLQALAAIIAQGKRGILLVPEIALTTQAIQRVAGRFPGRVAILHGSLSPGERYDEWRRIRAGEVDVVVGARSALFAPVQNLGMIILDEEHESAYKQTELRPTYHARETAIALGRILHIPVVLGSATPSVETFYRAEQGEYRLVELPGRIGASLPPVEIVDLRNELRAGNTSILSRRLQEELERVLSHKQQAILYLNRRGTASCVLCRDCGFVALCNLCDISFTYHSTERVLLCHYCGEQRKMLQFCPNCQSSGIRYFGLGTEKVEYTLQRMFPSARLLRWDRDTAHNHHAHAQLLDRFANREADILIGTQMIAKGLDLPGVTLVGVVSADIALNLPDYAAAERAFILLTQVAGRAGRGKEAGHVIIQTFNPQHFCIDTASRHAYSEFYTTEIETRRQYNYPPFRQFVKFTYSHQNRQRCQNEALLLSERLCEWIDRLQLADTDIVGPAPALIARIRGEYRWQIIARGPDLHQLLRVVDTAGWEVDIDPVSAM
jgi:primosomal protein N' (replication factor Y) (superfamily II helicase)